MKKAILFGAGGHVGGYLLHHLLDDAQYSEVIIVVREAISVTHPKLHILVADFSTLNSLRKELVADEVFITIGGAEPKIERAYPSSIARMTKGNGAKSIFVITAVGANPKSSMAFTRVKGEIERDITDLKFDQTHFFRVSMITGRSSKFRPGEKIMTVVWPLIDGFFLGGLKKYKGIRGKDVATAMHLAAQLPGKALWIYHWPEMMELVHA